ncbi:MAG TPA: hypothetical protein VJ911_04445 [Cryomorphaceae bacterium]|nr:hypothetical protein [Cryomorphaceae bacterium]
MNFEKLSNDLLSKAKELMRSGDVSTYLATLVQIQHLRLQRATIKTGK